MIYIIKQDLVFLNNIEKMMLFSNNYIYNILANTWIDHFELVFWYDQIYSINSQNMQLFIRILFIKLIFNNFQQNTNIILFLYYVLIKIINLE